MTSDNITKVKNSYYYFDRVIKNGKIITIKYSLFTDDILAAKALAIKIKSTIDKISNSNITKTKKSFNSFKSYINHIKNSSNNNKIFIDYKEYRKIFKFVVVNFYKPECLNNENLNLEHYQNTNNTYDNIKIEKKYSLECIVDEFIKNECVKQKSSDDTKNRYRLVAK